MNGRIYDPVLGQFMQPDNFIQTPEDYIGYDRYSYCRGNPFKFTDPSGELLDYGGYSRMWDMASAAVAAAEYGRSYSRFKEYEKEIRNQRTADGYAQKDIADYLSALEPSYSTGNGTGATYQVTWDGHFKFLHINTGTEDEGLDVYYGKMDAEGNPNQVYRMPAGTLMKLSTTSDNGDTIDAYMIIGDAYVGGFFEFLNENTNVEWGLWLTGEPGEQSLNFFTTTHERDYDKGIRVIGPYLRDKGNIRVRDKIHSHPFGDGHDPSGYWHSNIRQKGDIGTAHTVQVNFGANVRFSIYDRTTKKYYYYNQNGSTYYEQAGITPF